LRAWEYLNRVVQLRKELREIKEAHQAAIKRRDDKVGGSCCRALS
jgi:hypothetical protein